MRVGRAEVVAPFRDAMGFVDSDAGELVLGVNRLEMAAEGFRLAELRCHVQKAGARMATSEVVKDDIAFWRWGAGVYGCYFYAGGF